MTKILVYELNEVPWRVVDRYVGLRPKSNLSQMLNSASLLTTRTTDSGELHPWSTWPTMHRGVNNDSHNIRFINQDLACAKHAPPLWSLLIDAGVTTGICGCLQSFPPNDHANMRFHIPDTFAPSLETIPDRYENFQRINLKLTGENRAVASRVGFRDLISGLGMFRSGVSVRTGLRLFNHLASERINGLNRSLRAIMQAHVAFDVFMDAVTRTRPAYAAVFSNHVAGMMHRYWKYAFPEDFDYSLQDTQFDRFHRLSIVKAIDIFDEQLGALQKFADRHGYDVVVSSSMGQEAVHRDEYIPELKLDDIEKLSMALGFDKPVRMNLAMQPDVALLFESQSGVERFKVLIEKLTDKNGNQILFQRYGEQNSTLNLSTRRAISDILFVDGKAMRYSDVGFSLITRDPGTGYHQPDGILLWKGRSQPSTSARHVVDSRQYAPTILKAMGAPVPSYMMDPID